MKGCENLIYGYIRVSTRDQNTDRQLIALKEYGIKPENILTDKMSGKDFNRPAYRRLLKRIHKGDCLVIKSIDRLGRNYKDIIKQWQHITKDIGADIKVLDMPILDTRQHKDLLGTFISDMVLQLLSYVAENERVNIKQRQAEGIASAKERGVRFGRPTTYDIQQYAPIFARVKAKELSPKQAMAEIGCCQSTYYRIQRQLKSA
ncbi:MAG: recombinase family protein [Firmicutes bacterium]|nr:recombinase family protein [Bacillota bacterium]